MLDFFARIIIKFTKTCFILFAIGVVLYLIAYYTNIGGSKDFLYNLYYQSFGHYPGQGNTIGLADEAKGIFK